MDTLHLILQLLLLLLLLLLNSFLFGRGRGSRSLLLLELQLLLPFCLGRSRCLYRSFFFHFDRGKQTSSSLGAFRMVGTQGRCYSSSGCRGGIDSTGPQETGLHQQGRSQGWCSGRWWNGCSGSDGCCCVLDSHWRNRRRKRSRHASRWWNHSCCGWCLGGRRRRCCRCCGRGCNGNISKQVGFRFTVGRGGNSRRSRFGGFVDSTTHEGCHEILRSTISRRRWWFTHDDSLELLFSSSFSGNTSLLSVGSNLVYPTRESVSRDPLLCGSKRKKSVETLDFAFLKWSRIGRLFMEMPRTDVAFSASHTIPNPESQTMHTRTPISPWRLGKSGHQKSKSLSLPSTF